MFANRTRWNLTPNRLSETLAQHRAQGKPLLDLTASNPTECGFEYDSEAILKALCNPAALTYEPNPKGLEAARHAVMIGDPASSRKSSSRRPAVLYGQLPRARLQVRVRSTGTPVRADR